MILALIGGVLFGKSVKTIMSTEVSEADKVEMDEGESNTLLYVVTGLICFMSILSTVSEVMK